MKKNKKGFTLVELLAVIIVLIIIMLIAINLIRTYTKNSKMEALKANALSYIKAVDDQAGLDVLETTKLKTGVYNLPAIQNLGVKLSGTKPDSALFCVKEYKVTNACFQFKNNRLIYENGEITSIKKGSCENITQFECQFNLGQTFEYTGSVQVYTAPTKSIYKVELWGAQGGGNDSTPGGKGAYTAGFLSLDKGEKLYVYVGEKGRSNSSVTNSGSFNGGGYSGDNSGSYSYGGGGATDVRLLGGSWSDAQGLRSRIMVAAGGGGNVSVASSYSIVPGVGGGLTGGNAVGTYDGNVPTGATQTGPGNANNDNKKGSFGYARQGNVGGWGGGGGGGYWGGSMGNGHGGSGGSSYISGYTGAVAVQSVDTNNPKTGCSNGTKDKSCSIHYSGISFDEPIVIAGNSSMPTHDGTSTMKGNSGHGYARISPGYYIENDDDKYSKSFDLTNSVEKYKIGKTGTYKLEVWGAQGGSVGNSYIGGYGAYSVGEINLTKGQVLYISVGGQGSSSNTAAVDGGYNGGGVGHGGICNEYSGRNGASGGGATSIATVSGVLSELDTYKGTLNNNNTSENTADDYYESEKILIVAGGGGGGFNLADWMYGAGGHAGGIIGNNGTHNSEGQTTEYATGGTQTTIGLPGDGYTPISSRSETFKNIVAASFGHGGNTTTWDCLQGGGGGSGFYGGGSGTQTSGAGGSSYIGNSTLSNKSMYCYNCTESNAVSTKTVSVTCAEDMPSANCAKKGNGYAKITYLGN